MEADPELEAFLDAVPGWMGRPRRVVPLEGGVTNRTYRVVMGSESFVLRVRGEETHLLGADPEVEYQVSLLAAAAGIGPEVIAYLRPAGILVTRFIEGVPLSEEALHEAPNLRRVAASLKKVHGAGCVDAVFSPFREAENYERTALDRRIPLPAGYEGVRAAAREIESALPALPPCLCHNDINITNFIDDGTTIRFVDWEYARMGDRYFDLGCFASEHQLSEDEEWTVLRAYFERPVAADHSRMRLMRFMADFNSAMWSVLQEQISTLDFDFKAYGAEYFDRVLAVAGVAEHRVWLSECKR